MDEATFWTHLEYRTCREMAGVGECKTSGMWCDGFIADAVELEARPARIIGRAWIGLGRTTQESWTFELLFPTPVTSVEEICWADLLPAENATRWLCRIGSTS